MSQEKTLFIAPDGTLTFIYDDQLMAALGDLGEVTTTRASSVEPAADGKHWTADMSPICGQKVVLGPFATREEALAAEYEWLIDYFKQEGPCPRS